MEETLELVQVTYRDMVARTRLHYTGLFDRTWTLVLRSVRKNIGTKHLPRNVKHILNTYRESFENLQEREQELFKLEDRTAGLELCQQLLKRHQSIEDALHLELMMKIDLSDEQSSSLKFDAKRRVAKQHDYRKAVRLSIDQGQVFLRDISYKQGIVRKEDIDEESRGRWQVLLDDSAKTAHNIFTAFRPKAPALRR